MYVCLCYALTDKDIKKNIQHGCLSLKKLQQNCKAGTSCGACLLQLDKILKQSKEIKSATKDSRK
jgi:bacterioferritin-associated ferredoxin